MTEIARPFVEVSAVTKSFGLGATRVDVLHGVDLILNVGERVAVAGASGAGKSTFLHIIGGLDRPSSGTVRFAGDDIFAFKGVALDDFRNRMVGFVFQFHQLLPEFTALENVMMPALIARLPRHEAQQRADQLLTEVGLAHRLRHKPGQLSGGEQQRVAIARALVMQPRLLLADEPTGNLDSATSGEIYALLDRLHQSYGLTIVVVTHSETLAARMDRIVHMRDGIIDG